MRAKDVILELLKAGFVITGQRGSHVKLKKGNLMTIVPVHSGDIPIGTLRAISKQTGVKLK